MVVRAVSGALACGLLVYSLEMPELPQLNTGNFLPGIRAQIEHAEAEAGARPRDAKAAGNLAMTLHAYQLYSAAEPAYQRARTLEPQNFDWVYLLATVQMGQGEFGAAVGSFHSALQIRPEDLAAKVRLAESLLAIGRWDEAGALYRRILDGHPNCAQAWYGLGRVQSTQGDHKGAAQSYTKACDLFPRYGSAHFALAGELRRCGKPVEADQQVASYRTYATIEPPLEDPLFQQIHELNQSTQARLEHAAELEKTGNFIDAIRELEAALSSDPRNVQANINLIALYARAGDPAKAKQHFEEAIKLNPGRSDAWYDYGVLLAREKNYTEAENAYQRALAINPQYAEAHNNLGDLYEQQGRLDDAAYEFHEAVVDRPDYPLARFHLGRILVHQQKYDEAIQHFLRALEPESEETPTYLYALGATYARAGDHQRALEYLHKARDGAAARNQTRLQSSIDRDLQTLETGR